MTLTAPASHNLMPHEHDFTPLGFTRHNCGGLVPTDVCACGLYRFEHHGYAAAGAFVVAVNAARSPAHLVRTESIVSHPELRQVALCGTAAATGWQSVFEQPSCSECLSRWQLSPVVPA